MTNKSPSILLLTLVYVVTQLACSIKLQATLACPEEVLVNHSNVDIKTDWTESFYKFNDKPFDRDKWVVSKFRAPCYDQHTEDRHSMVIDLIENHHVFEISTDKLRELLGPPNHEQRDLLCYVIYADQYRHSYQPFSLQFLIEEEHPVAVRIHSYFDKSGQSGWCRPNKKIVLDPKRPIFEPHHLVELQDVTE
jgi:hypothetical protein